MAEKSKITIATHNGSFHADDIFAVATLSLLLEKDHDIGIVRTRDQKKIETAEYVVDVGSVYDESKNRFDHHQTGGAGVRANGIPYSSIGLVWKKYGEGISGTKEIAQEIEQILVLPIDAGDNGVDILKEARLDVLPYRIQDIVRVFRTTWKEDQNELDARFIQLVYCAKEILKRHIQFLKDNLEAKSIILEIYSKIEDKRLLILDICYPFEVAINDMPEVFLVVYPNINNENWCLEAIEYDLGKYNQKILFPESWAGKEDDQLEKVSGVSGAVFCHNRRFFAVTKTKEAAIELAKLALKEAGEK